LRGDLLRPVPGQGAGPQTARAHDPAGLVFGAVAELLTTAGAVEQERPGPVVPAGSKEPVAGDGSRDRRPEQKKHCHRTFLPLDQGDPSRRPSSAGPAAPQTTCGRAGVYLPTGSRPPSGYTDPGEWANMRNA